MKTMNMISRRSFLKAAMAAATVSALGLTGCGSSASSTASSTASSAAASSAAASEAGQTFKVGIVNYVDHASLNQIVASVEERLDEVGKEKGVTFDYADYYANAQADQTNLNQIGADLVADGVDVIVAVATPTAATMLAAVEDTDIPVVYSAVTDPAAAGFDTEPNITGTSDALNTDAIMNLILAVNPDIDTIGLLYDLSQDASTQAIADAKAFCDSKGIKYIEKNGTTTAEVQMAAEALIAAGVKAVFTPTDNVVMAAEVTVAETLNEAGIPHYTGADSFVRNGAFTTCGVNYTDLGTQTADLAYQVASEGMDGMEDYFRASLDLLDSSVRRELFQSDRPICTKAHDTPPALYAPGSAVKNSVMTAGSIIEGSVENSVCFRNVRIEKGAVVKNCVLMEKCVVKAGARLENVVCDKNVTVSEDKIVCGTAEHPCVLAKGGVV